MSKSLMTMLLEAGVKRNEMFTHESDLYVFVTSITTEVINKWCNENGFNRQHHCPIFRSATDRREMYECIFQNDEYWSKVHEISKQIEGR